MRQSYGTEHSLCRARLWTSAVGRSSHVFAPLARDTSGRCADALARRRLPMPSPAHCGRRSCVHMSSRRQTASSPRSRPCCALSLVIGSNQIILQRFPPNLGRFRPILGEFGEFWVDILERFRPFLTNYRRTRQKWAQFPCFGVIDCQNSTDFALAASRTNVVSPNPVKKSVGAAPRRAGANPIPWEVPHPLHPEVRVVCRVAAPDGRSVESLPYMAREGVGLHLRRWREAGHLPELPPHPRLCDAAARRQRLGASMGLCSISWNIDCPFNAP